MSEGSGHFVTSGAIPLGSGASYVKREHEDICFDLLNSQKWVLLLGPRQHGKTSSLIRLRVRLQESGYDCAFVDLQAYGANDQSYSHFLQWLCSRISSDCGVSLGLPPNGREEDLDAWLVRNLPSGKGAIALILDEAGAVPSDHRVRFFSQLRAIYNARSYDEASIGRRIVIVFAGTFRPDEMIDTGNSPFNVSEEVRTENFSLAQTVSLAVQVDSDLEEWAPKIYAVTGGQPYLTQRYFASIVGGATYEDRAELWSAIDTALRGGRDRHFESLMRLVIDNSTLKEIVRQVVDEHFDVVTSAADSNHTFLEVIGIARREGQRLKVSCPLYRDVIASMPQIVDLPVPTPAGANPAVVLSRDQSSFSFIVDISLREVAYECYCAGANSYRSSDYRLALVSFGSCLEAVLLDFLEQLDTATLIAATTAVHPPPQGSIARWEFKNLVEVAHNTPRLGSSAKVLAQQIRDWRNLVHPDNARRNFQHQLALEPEVRIAVAAVDKVVNVLQSP